MAPSPEYDKEPKAPDKSATHISSEDTKLLHNLVNDQHKSSDYKTTNSATNSEVENKHVETLDDEKLRALLDEAITYKCPKDREGKSSLFKELLEEVEQDEQACEAAARSLTGCRGSRRGARGRRALPHSNSLQDLVAALAAEPAPRHTRHHPRHHAPAPSNVSARAIHGGSLPSGVDTSSLLSEEGSGAGSGAGYLATVRCVNPPPLAERRVSASDANAPHELDLLNTRRSKPMFPMTYTARATLEIGSGSVCSGRAVTTTTASNQVDSAIPFSCITTPEVVASCNTTSSSSTAVAIDPKPLQLGSGWGAVTSLAGSPPSASTSPPARPSSSVHDVPELQPRSVIASSFNGLPLSRPNYGSTASSNEEYKKSLDENGNAVQGFSSPLSGSSQHKKPRRKKSSKNETVIDCQQIDGYRGDKADLDELLRFIENNPETRAPKMRPKHKDDTDDKATKKRSSERRKDKEKVKRASSLEELSRTKLEDLTSRAAPAPKPERRSWGDATPSAPTPAPTLAPEPTPAPAPEPKETPTPPPEPEPEIYEPIELPTAFELPALPLPDPIIEQADFQTVTKKRKPRRRTEEAPRRTRQPSPRRQESAPPSERSNDSNDDMDSVHSLPQPVPLPPVIPHASYADIARTRHNIPDLIESCNYYTEGETNEIQAAPAPIETDGYPALETKFPEPPPPALPRRREIKQHPPLRRDRKSQMIQQAPPLAPECPAPDVVADRRPPVILLDSNSRPRDMDGVTFGFDINEQLLGGTRRPRCDLVRDAVEPPAPGLPVRAACRPLRYIPPDPPPDSHHLNQIIDYVGAAWEDVVRCGGAKVRYFSE